MPLIIRNTFYTVREFKYIGHNELDIPLRFKRIWTLYLVTEM